jgi:hypothetical protein
MSDVDRLSNSGLYPALPIADRKRDKDEPAGKPPPDPRGAKSEAHSGERDCRPAWVIHESRETRKEAGLDRCFPEREKQALASLDAGWLIE